MAGFREFLTGEVLTAANVNNFLMKQSVMVFADDAARTAALGAEVAEGMLTYNEDTAQLEVFDGTNFVVAAPEPAGIGSNVVANTTVTTVVFSAASFGSESNDITTLATTITPTSATSKILLIAHLSVSGQNRPANLGINLLRGATSIFRGTGSTHNTTIVGSSTGSARTTESTPLIVLDSPATTSAVTYNFRFQNLGDIGQNMNLNRGDSQNVSNNTSTVVLIEVAV